MSKKSRIKNLLGNVTMQALLREAGVTNVSFNIDSDVSSAKVNYERMMLDLDFQQVAGRYRWEGLPPYLTSWQIENMLYFRNSLVGFYSGGQLFILPYANHGGINVNGMPTSVIPLAYNGGALQENEITEFRKGLELIVNQRGGLNADGNCALLFDRLPMLKQGYNISRYALMKQIRDDQAEILARVRNNVRNSDKKLVYYCENEAQKKAFYDAIKDSYSADDCFVVVVRSEEEKATKTAGLDSEPLHTEVELQTQQLIECWQSLNNIRLSVEGIKSDGAFEKKERKITGELEGIKQQVGLISDIGLYMRKLFIEQMKVIYPDKIEELSKINIIRVSSGEMCYNKDDKEEKEDGIQTK